MKSYCAFENRKSAFIGAKLLALSLERHCRDYTLFLGVTEDDSELADWAARRAPHVELVRLEAFNAGSSLKHVKPLMMLHLFERGFTDVTWLDTDMLVLRDLESLIGPLPPDALLVAQEEMGHTFEHNRTLLKHYGLEPRRSLQYHVNSCVIRATALHQPLMKKFLDCLLDPVFVAQQGKAPEEKIHDFAFEQNILELLLSAGDKQWNPDFPVRFIPKGPGIIQELGVTTYKLRNRLRSGLGLRRPWLVHVPGEKPWAPDPLVRRYRAASVYSAFAETYRDEVEEDMSWANSAGISSRIARLLSFGQPHWVGWAHCLAGLIWRFVRTGSLKRKLVAAPKTRTPSPTPEPTLTRPSAHPLPDSAPQLDATMAERE
jgi:hypothetical protein